MKVFQYALAIIATFLTFSCKKEWFDIKSNQNITVPTTLQDFQLLLDNYTVMSTNTAGLGEISSDNIRVPESNWKLYSADFDNLNSQTNAYVWSNNRPYKNTIDWNKSYEKIFICNLILEGLEKINVNPANEKQFSSIKGDALFRRAKTYYELAQLYSEDFDQNQDSRFGLPLKTNSNINSTKRSTVHETYNMIINDLKQALEILPLTSNPLTRANKVSTWALLSRVYLQMGLYQNAYDNANIVLKYKSDLIDYNTLPSPATYLPLFNEEVLFHSSIGSYAFLVYVVVFIPQELIDQYDDNDLRKEKLFEKSDSGYMFLGSYAGDFVQFSGISTNEIFLIRAESAARLGEVSNAIKDLNLLIKTRFKVVDGQSTFVPIKATTKEDALNVILTERRKELLMRGIRWSDLKRLNKDPKYQKTINRHIGGAHYQLIPGDSKYVLPIPQDELNHNSIDQNPGW